MVIFSIFEMKIKTVDLEQMYALTLWTTRHMRKLETYATTSPTSNAGVLHLIGSLVLFLQ